LTNPNKEYKNRESLSNQEIDSMISKARNFSDPYFSLRSVALVSFLKKFGKRRSEICSLKIIDIEIDMDDLIVTFTIRKKHKKGFFQFLKWIKETDPNYEDRPLVVLKEEHKFWSETHKEGSTVKVEKRQKKIKLKDRYIKNILKYLDYLKDNFPEAKYVFPSGYNLFGEKYHIIPDKHLSGRQILNLIKELNPKAWVHLFRDFVGGEIARKRGDSIIAVAEVKRTLDLENDSTAMVYINRHAVQVLEAEE
jgi:integrase